MNTIVADDNEDALEFMTLALRRAGHAVRSAFNGARAIELQEAEQSDLLITDIYMPEKDGIETIREFRRRFPHTKIIAISGGGPIAGHQSLRVAGLLGADALLKKPFSSQDLLATVASVGAAKP